MDPRSLANILGWNVTLHAPSVAGFDVKTVTLTWTRSSDDGGGEGDIQRYAIYRRLDTDTLFSEPFTSIPASVAPTYSFVDGQVVPGQAYVYGIVAQDCTPLLSSMSVSAAVTVNP